MAEAGWHPDPAGRNELRYFDGTAWTEHVSNGGSPGTDPLAGNSQPAAQQASSPWGQSGSTGGFSAGGFSTDALPIKSLADLAKVTLPGRLIGGGLLVGLVGLFLAWVTIGIFGASVSVSGFSAGDGKLYLLFAVGTGVVTVLGIMKQQENLKKALVAVAAMMVLLALYEIQHILRIGSGVAHVGLGLYIDTAAAIAVLVGAVMGLKQDLVNQ